MTNTCKHDFQFCYKGNRGIALRCSRCGKPAEFRTRFCIWRWLMFCIVTLLFYVEFMSRSLFLAFCLSARLSCCCCSAFRRFMR